MLICILLHCLFAGAQSEKAKARRKAQARGKASRTLVKKALLHPSISVVIRHSDDGYGITINHSLDPGRVAERLIRQAAEILQISFQNAAVVLPASETLPAQAVVVPLMPGPNVVSMGPNAAAPHLGTKRTACVAQAAGPSKRRPNAPAHTTVTVVRPACAPPTADAQMCVMITGVFGNQSKDLCVHLVTCHGWG